MDKENQVYATRRSRRTIVIHESKEDEATAGNKSSKKRAKPVLKKQTHIDLDDKLDMIANEKEAESKGSLENCLALETPRRSTRKSIRPIQDYQDIILMTSSKKKAITARETVNNEENDRASTKWTPSSVGRSSEKRARKGKRVIKTKNLFNAKDIKEDDGKSVEQEESGVLPLGNPELPKDFEKNANSSALMENNEVPLKLDETLDSNLVHNAEDNNKNKEVPQNAVTIKNKEKLKKDIMNEGEETTLGLGELKIEINDSAISRQMDQMASDSIGAKDTYDIEEASDGALQEKPEVPIKLKEPDTSDLLENEENIEREEETTLGLGELKIEINDSAISRQMDQMASDSIGAKDTYDIEEASDGALQEKPEVPIKLKEPDTSDLLENEENIEREEETTLGLGELKIEINDSAISRQMDQMASDSIGAKDTYDIEEASDGALQEKPEVPIKLKEPDSSDLLETEENNETEETELKLEEDVQDFTLMKNKDESMHNKLIEKEEEALQLELSKTESVASSNEVKRSSIQPFKFNEIEQEDEYFPEVKEETDDKFGNYLKSNKIDISDLGLKPLDADVNDEMPSLLVVDDSLDGEEPNLLEDEPKLNETFDASDSVIFVDENASPCEKEEDLILPDTTELTSLVSNIENKKVEKIKKQVRINPDQANATPEKPSKTFRIPTPHKTKTALIYSNMEKETGTVDLTENDVDIGSRLSTSLTVENDESESIDIPVRRRSKSLTLEKPKRNVYFHSPANQTALIEDLDILLSKKKNPATKDTSRLNNVTIRRKRSLSADDLTKLELPKPSLQKLKPSSLKKETKLRTKLPNFAAIHQKQFEKMENLEEFLERKAERAKLLNSGSKVPLSSSKKTLTRSGTKRDATGVSKASKKIDLELSHNNMELEKPTSTYQVKKIKPTIIIESKQVHESNKTEGSENIQHLPNPCDLKYKTKNLTVSEKVFNTIPSKSAKKVVERKILKPANGNKPAFNLSTAVSSSSTMNSSVMRSATKGTSSFLNNTTVACSRDTNTSRVQRRMDMFKGRPARKGNPSDLTQRQNEIIKGVRSNRRFELQMQHRRNFES